MNIKAPRGTYDAMPGQIERFQYIEEIFRTVAERFGYKEIRTPVFESTELFERGVGDTTDIVQKEMYTFTDRGDRSITLRPEGTSPVVRAFVESKIYGQAAMPMKYYYAAIPILRYERPQAGRLRQHHQFGIELFGTNDPRSDVEVIDLLNTFYKELGLKKLKLEINSVGCPDCREEHRKALYDFLYDVKDQLCSTCQERLEKNPMRILDCKNPSCQKLTENAPVMVDYLCGSCLEHYNEVKNGLSNIGLEYNENYRLVRGLDYYTQTAFEFIDYALDNANDVIGGGGRYNGLIEEIGGPEMPGIGFGSGLERIDLALEAEGVAVPTKEYCHVFVLLADEKVLKKGQEILHDLRKNKISADTEYTGRSFRAQMKHADRLNAKYTIILGSIELEKCHVIIRDMKSGEQNEVNFADIVSYFTEG
ncbi:MAG: histidine--tRNA ligase [Clostridia bacterium]